MNRIQLNFKKFKNISYALKKTFFDVLRHFMYHLKVKIAPIVFRKQHKNYTFQKNKNNK